MYGMLSLNSTGLSFFASWFLDFCRICKDSLQRDFLALVLIINHLGPLLIFAHGCKTMQNYAKFDFYVIIPLVESFFQH